ncbi:hypothetical protein [Microbacterium tenebrionis]|uniref:hypothetical protein n=1 Tax=Microbacterium tenebrionis TaxID=2830665 RepID=UPI00158E832C|nr:hypothetical protein [Microbacterium ihumii]
MANNNDGSWPPKPETDDAAFERVTEGQETILGTGGQPPRERFIETARPHDE